MKKVCNCPEKYGKVTTFERAIVYYIYLYFTTSESRNYGDNIDLLLNLHIHFYLTYLMSNINDNLRNTVIVICITDFQPFVSITYRCF